MTSKDFHNKCDNKGPTICLFKNEKGNIFGGYTNISWNTDDQYHQSSECFLFTLTNIYGTSPMKFANSNIQYSVYHNSSYGPTFGGGHDIYFTSNFLSNYNQSHFPNSYNDSLGKGKSIFTGDTNNNNAYFKLKEMEVFLLLK